MTRRRVLAVIVDSMAAGDGIGNTAGCRPWLAGHHWSVLSPTGIFVPGWWPKG